MKIEKTAYATQEVLWLIKIDGHRAAPAKSDTLHKIISFAIDGAQRTWQCSSPGTGNERPTRFPHAVSRSPADTLNEVVE